MKAGRDLDQLVIDMQAKIEAMTKWLRDSGLTVNKAKMNAAYSSKMIIIDKSKDK